MIDRSTWPSGPWDDEPDEWSGEYLGFQIRARRSHLGHWCGYIIVRRLPPSHPWTRVTDDLDLHGVTVHGGITWARSHGPLKGDDDSGSWWVGFDCGHLWDVTPGMLKSVPQPRAAYRTLEYVQRELKLLAHQAKKAQEAAQ